MRHILGSLVRLAAWGVSGILLTAVLTHPTNRVIAQWQQSGKVHYDSSGPYSLSVVEGGINLFSLPLHRTQEVFVGRGSDSLSDGDHVLYSFHSSYDNLDVDIRACRVAWTPAGVTLIEPSGNRLFIAKRMFAHGPQ